MAASFRFNNATTPSTNAGTNDAWKAAGFINIYLPGAEGKQTKLGAIPLRLANADEKNLFDWLKADQPLEVDEVDENGAVTKVTMKPLEFLLSQLTVDFREVRQDGGRFNLPGMGSTKGNPPF